MNTRSALTILLLLAACSSQPQPAPLDAPDNLPPPAAVDPQPPAQPLAEPGNDGAYRGTGTLTRNPKGTCIGQLDLDGMVVQAGQVQFGRFSGSLRPDGSVRMVSGRVHVQGRFRAGRFQGSMTDPTPGCDYRLDLTRFE